MIGVAIHKPTVSVFHSLAYNKVPVNLLASVSLMPPVFQAIRKHVIRANRPLSSATDRHLFDRFNEGGTYKLWSFKMFRYFIEYHCLVNPATRNQWYLVCTLRTIFLCVLIAVSLNFLTGYHFPPV